MPLEKQNTRKKRERGGENTQRKEKKGEEKEKEMTD